MGDLYYHCDKIKKPDNVVFLFSFGRVANFYVHTPEMGGNQKTDGTVFEFKSGDVLFFDSTDSAQMYHGIPSIGSADSCPDYFAKSIGDYRVSLQIRGAPAASSSTGGAAK